MGSLPSCCGIPSISRNYGIAAGSGPLQFVGLRNREKTRRFLLILGMNRLNLNHHLSSMVTQNLTRPQWHLGHPGWHGKDDPGRMWSFLASKYVTIFCKVEKSGDFWMGEVPKEHKLVTFNPATYKRHKHHMWNWFKKIEPSLLCCIRRIAPEPPSSSSTPPSQKRVAQFTSPLPTLPFFWSGLSRYAGILPSVPPTLLLSILFEALSELAPPFDEKMAKLCRKPPFFVEENQQKLPGLESKLLMVCRWYSSSKPNVSGIILEVPFNNKKNAGKSPAWLAHILKVAQ